MRGLSLSVLGVAALVGAGCATTTGGDQVANSVYATHRIVKTLETDLSARVDKLNQTAADLSAKVDASDQTTRQLQSLMEENQAKLNAMQKNLDRLSQVVYRQFGLSPGSGGVKIEGTGVEPPTTTTPMGTTPVPAPGSAVAPGEPAAQTLETTPPAAPSSDAAPVEPLSSNAAADYKKASEAYMNDNFEEALAQYTQYLQKYPTAENAGNAQYWKAECLRKMGQWEQAVREYDTMRQSFPSSKKVPPAMFYQADCYLRMGQQQRAIDLLKDLSVNEKYATDAAAEQARGKLKELQGQ